MLSILAVFLLAYQGHAAGPDYYTAAVVELASPTYLNFTADEVMLANAAKYVTYVENAWMEKVDIIVFPEGGLQGSPIEMPSPEQQANPCKDANKYHMALVLLSCAAKKYNMYLVLNNGEKYYNSTTNKTEYYNSNVAFDRNGTVVARYRKFNPYGEPVEKPVLDLHTFETDFDITFGMFICFDIDFEEPGVVLARDLGIKHFAFPHCWISELPFLTAIQAQWGFAYSLDTVLLASGCNKPSQGGTGSGIYQGRQGALQYFQTNDHTSRLIVANVSKTLATKIKSEESEEAISYKEPTRGALSDDPVDIEVHLLDSQQTPNNSSLYLLRDYTDVYESRLLTPSGGSTSILTNTSVAITLTTETEICQGTLCCQFKVTVTSDYNLTKPAAPARGDDFTHQFYRLVAFDGVRWYGGGIATGGVQICGVISCVNESLSSCGLRSDDPTAQVATYATLYKVSTVFESIAISGKFRYNRTFLYPDMLTTASGDSFGALVPSNVFSYQTLPPQDGSVIASLSVNVPLPNLITASIYARQFDRDGLNRTELYANSFAQQRPQFLFTLCVLFLFIFNCIFSWIN